MLNFYWYISSFLNKNILNQFSIIIIFEINQFSIIKYVFIISNIINAIYLMLEIYV